MERRRFEEIGGEERRAEESRAEGVERRGEEIGGEERREEMRGERAHLVMHTHVKYGRNALKSG